MESVLAIDTTSASRPRPTSTKLLLQTKVDRASIFVGDEARYRVLEVPLREAAFDVLTLGDAAEQVGPSGKIAV